jgi:hypothetical protein
MTPLDGASQAAAVTAALGRANKLVAKGRTRRAADLLELELRARPAAVGLRHALAQLYRDLDHRDQAGRWGIALEGWTTPLERDRLARLLAASPSALNDLTEFLALPSAVDGYPDLAELMDGPVQEYLRHYENFPVTVTVGRRQRLLRAVMFWRR